MPGFDRKSVGVVVGVVVLGGSVALAQKPATSDRVDEFYGAYQEEIAIAVPPFHGIEPRLSLQYSSAGGNGSAGVGWSLGGFSVIERASPGRGAPRYDANDIYLLDGQELVACAAGSASPSCTTGGTHATKIESYTRVKYDGASNTWTVWQKDGTRSTYGAVYVVGRGTFRWGLTSVTDPTGNTVHYGWWCDPGADCYPDTVSYNGTVVRLYREARPDEATFANGEYLGRTRYRLKTIDVTVSGARVRAYKLTYTTSASTSRSLLASVQQFGRDATVDGSGTVTGGSALPAVTLGYDSAAAAFASTEGWPTGGYQAIGVGSGDDTRDGELQEEPYTIEATPIPPSRN